MIKKPKKTDSLALFSLSQRMGLRRYSLACLSLLFVGALFYFFFFLDAHLKSSLEYAATRANLAQVTIGSLETHWWKGKVTLTDVAITNYRQPMRNLAQLEQVTIDFDPWLLLRSKLHISDWEINQVRYDTPREASGYRPFSETHSPEGTHVTKDIIPALYRPLRKKLAHNPFVELSEWTNSVHVGGAIQSRRSELQLFAEKKKSQEQINRIKDAWVDWENSLPSETEATQAMSRWHDLKKTAPSKQHTERTADFKRQLTEFVRSGNNALAKMQASVGELRETIAKGTLVFPADVKRLKNELAMPELSHHDLSASLFADKLLNGWERVTALISLSRRLMPSPTYPETGVRLEKIDPLRTLYHFPDAETGPRLYLETGKILSKGDARHLAVGRAYFEDLSSSPSLTGRAAKGRLHFDVPSAKVQKLDIQFSINHSQNAAEEFRIEVESFPIETWLALDRPAFEFLLKKATASVSLTGRFSDDNVEAQLRLEIKGAQFRATTRNRQLATLFSRLNEDMSGFVLRGRLSGPFEALTLELQSELGSKVASQLRSTFASEIKVFEKDLDEQLEAEAKKQSAELLAQVERLETSRLHPVTARMRSLNELAQELNLTLN